jgi:hypothetical protein
MTEHFQRMMTWSMMSGTVVVVVDSPGGIAKESLVLHKSFGTCVSIFVLRNNDGV